MRANEKTIANIERSLAYIRKLPEGTNFNYNWTGDVQVYAQKQEDVRKLRVAIGSRIWKKKFVDWAQYWTYTFTTRQGLKIEIAGVKEGPSQCRAIEETVIETRREPTGYRDVQVEVKRVRYECPEGK